MFPLNERLLYLHRLLHRAKYNDSSVCTHIYDIRNVNIVSLLDTIVCSAAHKHTIHL